MNRATKVLTGDKEKKNGLASKTWHAQGKLNKIWEQQIWWKQKQWITKIEETKTILTLWQREHRWCTWRGECDQGQEEGKTRLAQLAIMIDSKQQEIAASEKVTFKKKQKSAPTHLYYQFVICSHTIIFFFFFFKFCASHSLHIWLHPKPLLSFVRRHHWQFTSREVVNQSRGIYFSKKYSRT